MPRANTPFVASRPFGASRLLEHVCIAVGPTMIVLIRRSLHDPAMQGGVTTLHSERQLDRGVLNHLAMWKGEAGHAYVLQGRRP